MSRLIISSFVEKELQFFREACNFTPEELRFFDLRAKDKSILEICYDMNISESKANNLSSKIKQKITKVL